MSTSRVLTHEDQYMCPICLDVFTDPVTTPCGHNFCRTCINQLWDGNSRHRCPLCNKHFHTKPELQVNTLIREMVAEFKLQKASSSSEKPVAKAGEVSCDVCSGTKLKALKSCLVCLASYCETHLEPHLTAAPLRRHQLVHPVENLEGRMCEKHHKPLELFCQSDQTCICVHCTYSDHRAHHVVPLNEESEAKKAELVKTNADIQLMIQERQQKVLQMKQTISLSEEDAARKKEEGIQVFTALKESVERSLKEFLQTIEEDLRRKRRQTDDLIHQLEDEISQLMDRSTEVKQLSCSEDHLHLLQSFLELKEAPYTRDWTEVSVHPASVEGSVGRAVSQLEKTLGEDMRKVIDAEMKSPQQFEVDVTLDPDTAHPQLLLSEDGKQVQYTAVERNLPDNPERFSIYGCVLGKQSFSSGRFYFKVDVGTKPEWMIGVARDSIKRKEGLKLRPQEGSWTLYLTFKYQCQANDDPPVLLSLRSRPQKVGVFVDHDQGLVSFYDVDNAALIYTFTGCNFTDKLKPFFSLGYYDGQNNTTPLIICPVNQTSSS